MLVEFTVGNFLSFQAPVTLSMVASSATEFADTHIFPLSAKMNLLKSSVVYGPNASGKSNLFVAMAFMKHFIEDSARNMMADETIPVKPFKLCTSQEGEPGSFEMIFLFEGVKYRYGFQVTSSEVVTEWLYYTPNKRESKLFFRDGTGFEISGNFKEAEGLEQKTRKNALFLSVVAQFNGEISNKVLKWLKNFNILIGMGKNTQNFTNNLSRNDLAMKDLILKCLQIADLHIEDFEIVERDIPSDLAHVFKLLSESAISIKGQIPHKVTDVNVLYKKYDEQGEFVAYEKFDLEADESNGTKNLYTLLGPILDTLQHGKILVVDELDFGLHPLLTNFLVKLFHSTETNPRNAQLIFNTHNTNLLSNKVFRRDQIWFTDKDRLGATDLYSLIEYTVRKDATFNKDYLLGKYGAIPFIDDLDFTLQSETGGESNGE